MGFSLLDVPVIGDIYNAVTGDPRGQKEAYDAQIQASKDSQARLQQFLMGQQSKALGYYAPLQHMFQRAYGTEGLMGPQVPGGSQPMGGPLGSMYGGVQAPPVASAPPMPGGHDFSSRERIR